jgi:hypothetical protein
MSNPPYTPRTEAVRIMTEAVHRAYCDTERENDSFVNSGITPAYRRDVLRHLAKIYNGLIDKHGMDGPYLGEE